MLSAGYVQFLEIEYFWFGSDIDYLLRCDAGPPTKASFADKSGGHCGFVS
jgi:hypothetical protein